MAQISQFVDLSLENQTLLRAKIQPVTTTQRTTGAGTTFGKTLGAGDAGLLVYDTDINQLMAWNGTSWQNAASASLARFRGSISTLAQTVPSDIANGDWYIAAVDGTLTNFGGAVVQSGDMAIYNGTSWSWIEGNRDFTSFGRKSVTTITTLTANSPFTVAHSLGTTTPSVMCYNSSNQMIALAVSVTDANNITVTSHIGLSNVRVIVQG